MRHNRLCPPGGTLTVSGNTSIYGSSTLANNLTVSGLSTLNNSTVGGTLTVSGSSTLNNSTV